MAHNLYERWMYSWETRLTTRDSNRVVRPFDWGLEWTRSWPCVNGNFPRAETPASAERFLHDINQEVVTNSDSFFSYQTPSDFRLERRRVELFHTGSAPPKARHANLSEEADFLRFTSPVKTPYPENNLANARWFPAPGKRAEKKKRAIVILPQWNSDALSHNAICRAANHFGVSALRLSMPYHDIRMPGELQRADYAVSANVARTIDAARQAIIDIRCCLDWLEQQGYSDLGVMGTSLGSCYAFIASAHDPRLRVNIFNFASQYFADVVWTGQSTRHIRAGMEPAIDLERLRRAWLAISPISFFDKFAAQDKKSLLIYAKYDLTFLPQFSRQVAQAFKERNLDHKTVALPSGHYTTGEWPFKYIDGYHIVNFLRKAF